jgi:hypothetical protein
MSSEIKKVLFIQDNCFPIPSQLINQSRTSNVLKCDTSEAIVDAIDEGYDDEGYRIFVLHVCDNLLSIVIEDVKDYADCYFICPLSVSYRLRNVSPSNFYFTTGTNDILIQRLYDIVSLKGQPVMTIFDGKTFYHQEIAESVKKFSKTLEVEPTMSNLSQYLPNVKVLIVVFTGQQSFLSLATKLSSLRYNGTIICYNISNVDGSAWNSLPVGSTVYHFFGDSTIKMPCEVNHSHSTMLALMVSSKSLENFIKRGLFSKTSYSSSLSFRKCK